METAPSGPLQQDAALLPKYQSRRVYRAIRVGEVLCAIIALSCWYLAWFFGRGIPEGFSLQMILPFALFIIGLVAALTIIVLQLLAAAAITPTAARVLERDRRPPIIYLRSFSLDSLFGGNQEGEICKIFGGCGPVVAIGRPGEVFGNPNGAARLYVSNDRWQGTVLRLLDDARAVLLVAGKTTGVAWELRTVLSRVDPLKVLIIADGLDEYNSLRATANPTLSHPLPQLSGEKHFFAAIAFDRWWNPYRLNNAHKTRSYSDREGNFYETEVFDLTATLGPFVSRSETAAPDHSLAGPPSVGEGRPGADAVGPTADGNLSLAAALAPLFAEPRRPVEAGFVRWVWYRQAPVKIALTVMIWASIIGPIPVAIATFPSGKEVPLTDWVGFFVVYLMVFPCMLLHSQFEKSIERRARSLAGEILKFSACLGVEPISFTLLTGGAAEVGPASQSLLKGADWSVVKNTLGWIAKQLQPVGYAVISLDVAGESYSLNPVVAESIRQSMDPRELADWVRRSASVLASVRFPADASPSISAGSHIAAVLALADQLQVDIQDFRSQLGHPS